VVVGERGYCELVSPGTIATFLSAGFYGIGDGGNAAPALARHLEHLLSDADEREALGRFGVELVGARYDLSSAAGRLADLYRRVAAGGTDYLGVVDDTVSIGLRMGWEATKVLAGRVKSQVGSA